MNNCNFQSETSLLRSAASLRPFSGSTVEMINNATIMLPSKKKNEYLISCVLSVIAPTTKGPIQEAPLSVRAYNEKNSDSLCFIKLKVPSLGEHL